MREPRGRIVSAVDCVGEDAPQGDNLLLVVFVKTGSSRLRADFAYQCEILDIKARMVQELEYLTAYEVRGSVFALEKLRERACIREWQYRLDVKPAYRGIGTGPPARRRRRQPAGKRVRAPGPTHNEHLAQVLAKMHGSQEVPDEAPKEEPEAQGRE